MSHLLVGVGTDFVCSSISFMCIRIALQMMGFCDQAGLFL